VWRKLGSFASMAVGLIVGLGCYFTMGGHSAAPWFIGLFAFGMAAAARDRAGTSPQHDRRLFGWLTVCLIALYAWLTISVELDVYPPNLLHRLQAMWEADWPMDILVGAATAALLAYAAAAKGSPSGLVRFLSTRGFVWLGVVSYSLYLIHDPLLALLKILLIHLDYGPLTQFTVMIVVGLPLVLVITYGFHRVFEKPFMSARRVHGVESRGAISVRPNN
jgi:peptidoglycan/LPS O-acetylase OafA/YrhL